MSGFSPILAVVVCFNSFVQFRFCAKPFDSGDIEPLENRRRHFVILWFLSRARTMSYDHLGLQEMAVGVVTCWCGRLCLLIWWFNDSWFNSVASFIFTIHLMLDSLKRPELALKNYWAQVGFDRITISLCLQYSTRFSSDRSCTVIDLH